MADKGERIQTLFNRIEEELKARNEIDAAAALFSDLNIAENGLRTVTQMEWIGGQQTKQIDEVIDSDDDEDEQNIDPLKIIAQSRDNVKTVKILPPEPTLITAADLIEIESFANEAKESSANTSTSSSTSVELEPHALYICDKDKGLEGAKSTKKKFFAHKTTKSDVHNVDKEKQRVQGKNWEVTAATPPIIRNSEVKMLPLKESIEIEQKYQQELRDLQEKQAVERLEARKKLIADNLSLLPPGSDLNNPNEFFKFYRDPDRNGHDSDNESFSDNSFDGEEGHSGGVSVVVYD